MTYAKTIQINDADYGDGRVVIESDQFWMNGERVFAVPAWEEMGLGELEGPFASIAEAQSALERVARFLPDYGYRVAAIPA